MAAVRHLGFAVFVMWPLSACRFASSHKISPKSDNRSMSYGQKSDFEDGYCRHLEFQKFQFLVTWLQSGSTLAVVYRISLRYGDLTIVKMAAVRHLGFKKFAVFVMWPLSTCSSACWYKKISLKSDNRLMSNGQKAIFKIQFLVTWLLWGLIFAVMYQNFLSKSDDFFSLRYGDLAIFKMAAVRHLGL